MPYIECALLLSIEGTHSPKLFVWDWSLTIFKSRKFSWNLMISESFYGHFFHRRELKRLYQYIDFWGKDTHYLQKGHIGKKRPALPLTTLLNLARNIYATFNFINFIKKQKFHSLILFQIHIWKMIFNFLLFATRIFKFSFF